MFVLFLGFFLACSSSNDQKSIAEISEVTADGPIIRDNGTINPNAACTDPDVWIEYGQLSIKVSNVILSCMHDSVWATGLCEQDLLVHHPFFAGCDQLQEKSVWTAAWIKANRLSIKSACAADPVCAAEHLLDL